MHSDDSEERQRLVRRWQLASLVKLLLVALGWWTSHSKRLALVGVGLGIVVAVWGLLEGRYGRVRLLRVEGHPRSDPKAEGYLAALTIFAGVVLVAYGLLTWWGA